MGSSSPLEFSETTNDSTPPRPIPRLSLFSTMAPPPTHPPPGMATPPINSSAVSVPFQWEEAPGKPRPHHPAANSSTQSAGRGTAARRLELQLPPRLLVSSDCCRGMASPTTVLDGPDDHSVVPGPKTRRSPHLSFRGPASLSRRGLFGYGPTGSGRWKSFRKSNVLDDAHVSSAATFDPPPTTPDDGVKITRVIRRHASFFNLAAGTNVLANIYEGLKQVVPWRRVHEKKRRKGAF